MVKDLIVIQGIDIIVALAAPKLTAMACTGILGSTSLRPAPGSPCVVDWERLQASDGFLGSLTLTGLGLLVVSRGIQIIVHGILLLDAYFYLGTSSPSLARRQSYQNALWQHPAHPRFVRSVAVIAGILSIAGK